MANPLTLSIVIPAYNEENYLPACLEAIARQSLRPDEVIVIDNNSTDKTADIAARFSFVKVVKEKRQGAVHARNRGFNLAKSAIVARIDADTRLPKDWVRNAKKIFTDGEADAVTGPASGYDLPLPSANWLPHHFLCLLLIKLPPTHTFLFGFNMAIRKEAWQKVKPRLCGDKYMHEDLDIAIHLKQAGAKIKYSPALLVEASGRRFNDSWRRFHFYMKTYARSYRRHAAGSWLMYLAIAAYYLGYFFYRPWTFRRQARKNPMGV